jgi:hypothetical protein
MTTSDKRVDSYINKLPLWQQKACQELRSIIKSVDHDINETVKRTDRPYFVLKGNICALQATKDHINLFIYDPIADDPENVVNQGQNNQTARSVQIYENEAINVEGISKLLMNVVKNDRSGGWRKLIMKH